MAAIGNVEIIGGGPGGLYSAILLKKAFPSTRVRMTETAPRDVTWGFGVVFSDQALDFLKADDAEIHDLLVPGMEQWQNMTLNHPDGSVVLDGVGFSAVGRLELLQTLQDRAEALGVELNFGTTIHSLDELNADLIIGADGLNSLVRSSDPEAFGYSVEDMNNRFAWFGTPKSFDTLTQTFVDHAKGALNAHHYRYSSNMSTFIVEVEESGFDGHGFASMDENESAAYCAELFADVLGGQPLITNRSIWRRFPKLWCEKWISGNRALIGDAVHTAHFSIGSGTRLAMEDAIALVSALKEAGSVVEGLELYQSSRVPIAKKIVTAANASSSWYETFEERMKASPLDFAYSYITRSGRLDNEKLRKMAPQFMAKYDASHTINDPVGDDTPEAKAIGFDKAAHKNCSNILWDNLQRNPEALALTGPAGDVTYTELIETAGKWGNAFKDAGLAKGDRVALFLDDTPAYPASFFGAIRAGFVPVLLNTMTPADVLEYYLKDSEARLIVADKAFEELIGGLNVPVPLVVVGGEASGSATSENDFLASKPSELAVADTGPDDMAFWMYSSGTTGRPKGIVHLHHDMAYTQQSFAETELKLKPDDVCFSVPKIFFAYGFGNAITFPFSVGAATLLLPGRASPDAVLDAVETYKPTIFYGLPTLYTALCNMPGVEERDLSSLRQCMSAAEILSEDIFNKWKSLTGLPPIEGLGSTEMLHVYLSNSVEEQRLGSAGKAVAGYEVELRDNDGAKVKSGEEGVMYVRGHSSAPCYWNRPDKTEETMRGEWIYTGDRFYEQDGYYFFQGRNDDLIKVSGQWVWPLEVEGCLNEHPDIHECAVLAHELDDRRMTLRAVVSLREGAEKGDETIKGLQNFVKSRLQPHKYPRIVQFVDDLPKTGTGKLDRQAISKMD